MKKLLIIILAVAVSCTLLIILFFSVLHSTFGKYNQVSADKYIERIRQGIRTDNAEVQVSQIFTFSFMRAYVFQDTDCYMSGSEFSEKYDLNLSIDEVDSSTSDWGNRIVFVDAKGNLIYEFRYDYSELDFKLDGIVIYPTTRIRKCATALEGSVGVEFLSVVQSDIIEKPKDGFYEKMLINELCIKNKTVQVSEIFQFEFDRAYVIREEDYQLDGAQFSKFYHLDLSIDPVRKSDLKGINRIVFVDEKGNLLYEFRSHRVVPKNTGMIIYPATRLRIYPTIDQLIKYEFIDVKESDFYSAKE